MAGRSLAAFVHSRTALLRGMLCESGSLSASVPPAVVTIGNEACDLDSAASAIARAYLWDTDRSGRPYVPVLGAPRSDAVSMRGDVVHALGSAGLRIGDLLCLADITNAARPGWTLDLLLVDHNSPSVHWARAHGARLRVCGIVDHHEDAGAHLDASPRLIQSCGSTCSLVALEAAQSPLMDAEVALLLARAIVTDTVGMTWRATPTDASALAVLFAIIDGSHAPPRADYAVVDASSDERVVRLWAEMEAAQASIPEESVPLRLLMPKDYKQYDDAPGLSYGIAVVHVPFQHYLSACADGIGALRGEVRAFMAEASVRLLFFVNSVRTSGTHAHIQQFGIFSARDDAALLRDIVAYLQDEAAMGLNEIASDGCSSAVFEQANLEMTRKKVHPALKRFLCRAQANQSH